MKRMSYIVPFMLTLFVAMNAYAVTYSDGRTHVIKGFVSGDVELFDGPGPGVRRTRVFLRPGGEVENQLILNERSIARINGGEVGTYLIALDESKVIINSGTIHDNLETSGATKVEINGGLIAQESLFYDSTSVVMKGGRSADAITLFDFSSMLMKGGDTDLIVTKDNSNLRIKGGNFEELNISDCSVVLIFGSTFNLPFGPIVATNGDLIGTLNDGTPINVEFERASTASIILIQKP